MQKTAALVQELLNIQANPEAYLLKVAKDLELMTDAGREAMKSAPVIDPHAVDFSMKAKALGGAKTVGREANKYRKYLPALLSLLPVAGALIPGKKAPPLPPPTTMQRIIMAAHNRPSLAVGGLLGAGAGLGYLMNRRSSTQAAQGGYNE